jgi:hypothetical protein
MKRLLHTAVLIAALPALVLVVIAWSVTKGGQHE